MKAILIAALLVVAATSQVTVAPLFPASAAVVDFGLVALVALTFFAGPPTVMLSMPCLALFVGFLGDREPGLILLGYLPLLPLAAWLESARIPLSGAGRFLIVGVATGVSLRLAFTLGAALHGADIPPSATLINLLLPGFLLDAALLALVYVACRSIGWEPHRMSLQRGY